MVNIHVVSLPSSPRRRTIAGILNAHDVAFRFEDAFDARSLCESELNGLYDAKAALKRYGRTLTRGEVGCFLSHRSVWRKVVESGQAAIVLEDDAIPEDAFFDRVLNTPADALASFADIALLGRSKLPVRNAPRAYRNEPLKLMCRICDLTVGVPFKQWTSGSVGYWISVDGARKALAHSRGAISAVIDDWPWHRDHGGLRILEVRPYAVWEAFETMESSIDAERRVLIPGRKRWKEAVLKPLRVGRTAFRWGVVVALTVTARRSVPPVWAVHE